MFRILKKIYERSFFYVFTFRVQGAKWLNSIIDTQTLVKDYFQW